jgi:acetylornithine deacetylase/succinyl-diaminopimelate desuccinylase-like protein
MDWGRSFDMKGGVVANAAVICALTQADIKTGGDLVFESAVDEEWGGGGGTIAARPEGRRRRCLHHLRGHNWISIAPPGEGLWLISP